MRICEKGPACILTKINIYCSENKIRITPKSANPCKFFSVFSSALSAPASCLLRPRNSFRTMVELKRFPARRSGNVNREEATVAERLCLVREESPYLFMGRNGLEFAFGQRLLLVTDHFLKAPCLFQVLVKNGRGHHSHMYIGNATLL